MTKVTTWLQAVAAGWGFPRCAYHFGLPYAESKKRYDQARRVLAAGIDKRLGREGQQSRRLIHHAADQGGAELRKIDLYYPGCGEFEVYPEERPPEYEVFQQRDMLASVVDAEMACRVTT